METTQVERMGQGEAPLFLTNISPGPDQNFLWSWPTSSPPDYRVCWSWRMSPLILTNVSPDPDHSLPRLTSVAPFPLSLLTTQLTKWHCRRTSPLCVCQINVIYDAATCSLFPDALLTHGSHVGSTDAPQDETIVLSWQTLHPLPRDSHESLLFITSHDNETRAVRRCLFTVNKCGYIFFFWGGEGLLYKTKINALIL